MLSFSYLLKWWFQIHSRNSRIYPIAVSNGWHKLKQYQFRCRSVSNPYQLYSIIWNLISLTSLFTPLEIMTAINGWIRHLLWWLLLKLGGPARPILLEGLKLPLLGGLHEIVLLKFLKKPWNCCKMLGKMTLPWKFILDLGKMRWSTKNIYPSRWFLFRWCRHVQACTGIYLWHAMLELRGLAWDEGFIELSLFESLEIRTGVVISIRLRLCLSEPSWSEQVVYRS